MTQSINKVILVGNLGREPEIKETRNGTKIASISMATTESYKKQGEWQQVTEWHRVKAFGNLAEYVEKENAIKGDRVAVEGKIRTSKWIDHSGKEQRSTEVNASSIILMGGRKQKDLLNDEEDDLDGDMIPF